MRHQQLRRRGKVPAPHIPPTAILVSHLRSSDTELRRSNILRLSNLDRPGNRSVCHLDNRLPTLAKVIMTCPEVLMESRFPPKEDKCYCQLNWTSSKHRKRLTRRESAMPEPLRASGNGGRKRSEKHHRPYQAWKGI